VAAIARAVRASRIDLVHTHGVSAQIHAGLAARRVHAPVVHHIHDRFDANWSADGALQRLALRIPAARVIAISDTVAASLAGRVPPARMTTIDNGVDAAIVDPALEARSADAPLVVWCGRLQQWKGPQHFVAAAARVHAQRPDARFAIVGGTLFGLEPELAHALRRQAGAAGLDHALSFVGHVDDARPWMRAASLVVHSSERPEPFGLVLAEAMMQERPVVAFDHGGAAEIVVPGETGLLVPPGDTNAMANAVLTLLDDPAAAARLGAAGRARALQRFNADLMTASVAAVYDSVRTPHA
jgi:glycosyltransferase involved in cell wall biosynthesis